MKHQELPTTSQLLVIAHSVLDEKPHLASDPGAFADAVKAACARALWCYDGQRITRACESVLYVRQRRSA